MLVEYDQTNEEERPTPIKSDNWRANYLAAIGLSFDPFAAGVAELEIRQVVPLSREPNWLSPVPSLPALLAYLTPPPAPESLNESVLTALRRPHATFVFGAPGAGKTSTRLALEARCRREPDGTLVVRFIPPKDMSPQSGDDLWAATGNLLARDLAIDLFIQIVEQFMPGDEPPDQKQIMALAQQIKQGGRHLENLVRRLLETRPGGAGQTHLPGLAEHWPSVNRFAIRGVPSSLPLQSLLQNALTLAQTLPAPAAKGKTAWDDGVAAAQIWGFNRIFLLIDEVDTIQRDPAALMSLLTPFLDVQAAFARQNIYLKIFLPAELQSLIQQHQSQANPLTPATNYLTLTWDKAALRRLLHNRFRAAHSRRLGLNDLAAAGFPISLDTLILEAANGSPRRLLNVINELITIHLEQNPSNPHRSITYAEWEKTAFHLNIPIKPIQPNEQLDVPASAPPTREKSRQKQIARQTQYLSSIRSKKANP